MVTSFLFFQIFEDVHLKERPTLAKTLEMLNYIFAAIFSAEFVLKIIGFGLVKYMSSPWNCLDAFIVSVSSRATLRLCFYYFFFLSPLFSWLGWWTFYLPHFMQ